MKKQLSFIALLLLSALQGFSHALWIKTSPTGKLGQAQVITVTYAEPDEAPEKLSEWYSDVKEFELWLVAPDGKKEKLALTAGEDRFTATFTPGQEGIYTLTAGKSAKDLGGTTVYQFNASAFVKVGKSLTGKDPGLNANELALYTDAAGKVNKPLKLQTYLKGQRPSEKLYVTISSPSGWAKNVATAEDGTVEFVPLWPGSYAIEVSKNWKEEGEHFGKPYKGFWRCATLTLDVAK